MTTASQAPAEALCRQAARPVPRPATARSAWRCLGVGPNPMETEGLIGRQAGGHRKRRSYDDCKISGQRRFSASFLPLIYVSCGMDTMRCACGRPSPSPVCVVCTAHTSQSAMERLITMTEEALAAQMTGTMVSECCVCHVQYGVKPCLPAMDGQTSHGYCAACLTALNL